MKISKSLVNVIQAFNVDNNTCVFLVNEYLYVDGVGLPCVTLGEDDSDQAFFYVDFGDGYALHSASERFKADLPGFIDDSRDLRKAVKSALNSWEVL